MSMITLFKEQLENESKALAQSHGLEKRGDELIWWYFLRIVGMDPVEVEGVVCDGGGDLGIDAIWIDDDEYVHFYSFKNPEDPAKPFATGEVDKTISGLGLILNRRHARVANEELRARIAEIYQIVPKGYFLHFVTSGAGVAEEAKQKLDALIAQLSGPSGSFFQWRDEYLDVLQDTFYRQTLPALDEPIRFEVQMTPYMVRSGEHDSYFLHVRGRILAELLERFGEPLLQRNIRVDQGNSGTNRSIFSACGEDPENFLHFNNGVTFLCEQGNYDQFTRILTLHKSQVVNGGQTIRQLHRAMKAGSLNNEVCVPVRAITSSGDKEFSNSVAVNQNNQNQMGTGFLRSNDPRVIQLERTLASMGWYLERRVGELQSATDDEKRAIEQRIGGRLDGRVIRLKEGVQGYVATFFRQPELAKKNAKKMFLSSEDGGLFDRIFSSEMTAERVVVSHRIKCFVDNFIRQFATRKRRKDRVNDWREDYCGILGKMLVDQHGDVIDQVMPQSSIFLCGTIFHDLVDNRHEDPMRIPERLTEIGDDLIREHLGFVVSFAKTNPSHAKKSWPTLLKSQQFFGKVVSYIRGIREGK